MSTECSIGVNATPGRRASVPRPTYRIVTTRGFSLQSLWFPFPTRLTVVRGAVKMRQSGRSCKSLMHGSAVLPRMTVLTIEVSPDTSGAAELVIEPPQERVAVGEQWLSERVRVAMSQRAHTKQLTCEIATAVFFLPYADWSVAWLSSMAGVDKRKLSQRLRWENQCLSGIVKQQRCQREMLEALTRARSVVRGRPIHQTGCCSRSSSVQQTELFESLLTRELQHAVRYNIDDRFQSGE